MTVCFAYFEIYCDSFFESVVVIVGGQVLTNYGLSNTDLEFTLQAEA